MSRLLAGALVCASVWAAGPVVRVDEAATRVVLRNQTSTVLLAIENTAGRSVPARIRLEWVGSWNEIGSLIVLEEQLKPGASVVTIPLPLEGDDEEIWHRLRYHVVAEGEETGGIIPLAQIAAHVFELRVAAPHIAGAGELVRIPIFARHPITQEPVAGVLVKVDEEPQSAVTGKDGVATLEFRVPDHPEEQSIEITVKGSLGDFSQEVNAEFTVNSQPRITITTDKPLYQPGQTLHVRALIFNPAGRAMAGVPVSLRILDPEGIRMFTAPVETSRFGVVAADWAIPDNVRLGDYEIVIHNDDFPGDMRQQVKISRYDLPEFSVTAKPNRAYYLPGQNAVIEVKAEYLFGKPVTRGHVRVVRETSREWNYRLQKWEIEAAETYEADADASGRCAVPVKLAKAYKQLGDEDWNRFQDLGFTAYFRDPSTGRTEQRRFDVRISRDAIHIYPLRQGYISSSYADGSPASCNVTIQGGARVATNRYGVARLPDLPEDRELVLLADDGKGAKGRLRERYWSRPESELHLRTDKTLYRPGEAIHVEIESAEDVPMAAFTIWHGGELLETRWLDLRGRRLSLDIPWRKEFTREVAVAASWANEFAIRSVLYPADTDLRVDVQPQAAVYRPGEEAAAAIAVRLADGRPAESVLGIAVVDRAVGERARTDAEGGNSLGRWRWYAGVAELGGVSREDLYRLDCSRPIPADLDLLAEVMLAGEGYGAGVHTSNEYYDDLRSAFHHTFEGQFKPICTLLDARYDKSYEYPRDLESLRRMLREDGIDFDSLRDPWGTPYRVEDRIRGPFEDLRILSAGPDKLFGTADDVVAWTESRRHFRAISDAVARALRVAGNFPSSAQSAREALAAAHIDADRLPDPWGTMYRFGFEIRGAETFITFTSAGPDRTFGTKDDFAVGQISGQYFTATEHELENLLAQVKIFPQDERDWRQFLHAARLDAPRDPWGRTLYPVFSHKSSYADFRKLYTTAQYGSQPHTKTQIVPATLRFMTIRLRSAGPDGVEGNHDDFDLADFRRSYRVESSRSVPPAKAAPYAGGGSISGWVVDPTGARIGNASVSAILGRLIYVTQSASDGAFRLMGLAPGEYEVRIEAPGFQKFIASRVPVVARKNTALDAKLQLGSVAETVTVEAAPVLVQTDSASVSSRSGSAPRSTPRLREYFPETLLWQPSLETDADGCAHLKFKLADNITTWTMSVIGSTLDGQVGIATTDIRAFQPFFVDHDPPRVLTLGDSIDMPVTVRNYLDQTQAVTVETHPESWFELASPARRDIQTGAGESANALFRLRATASIERGKQRLTATSAAAGDAIEKAVSVHPDGQEISLTENTVLHEQAGLAIEIPAHAIAHSARAELKIYPNVLSHLLESIEGIVQRPYGCAEQTISSTYPSLLLLRALRQMGRADHPLAAKARRYLRSGVERLMGYRTESGGLTYWGRGEGDPSLTAYGLTFLTEASAFIPVDEDLIAQMRDALLQQQAKDGSWPAHTWRRELDPKRTALQTAYVARALSGPKPAEGTRRALAYLAARAAEIDEPYMIATLAAAARKAGDEEAFAASLDRLRGLARREAGMSYWDLRTNTPFYGWGLAGRLETTAAAVRALAADATPADRELIARGMLFLMRHKDRYGVWHSTQATIQVLNAILEASGAESQSDATSAEVMVNGRAATTLPLPRSSEVTGPVRADISAFLSPGVNQLRVRRNAEVASQVQVTAAYYVPWVKDRVVEQPELRLRVSYDRTAALAGEPITCRVHAERVGFHGYGMILAEIGLPPGADVDRQSLERAGLDHYDVLPNRVVAYLWPHAGGADFSFRFRPRFAMRAKAAPSLLYDYYNPDARAIQPPATFVITAPKSNTASAADTRPSARSAPASR